MVIPHLQAERLALLAGSNPLPNLFAIQVLQPGSVYPLHTIQTRPVMERLRKVVELGSPDFEWKPLLIQRGTRNSR